MKTATRPSGRHKFNHRTDSFSLSTAKTFLGRLVDKAGNGETVYILSGERRFILQEIPPIDPIPIRPEGYFANCYSKEEMDEQNKSASPYPPRLPRDLE